MIGQSSIYKFIARAVLSGGLQPNGIIAAEKTEEHIFQRVAFSPQMAVFLVSRAVSKRWPGWRVVIAPVPEGQ